MWLVVSSAQSARGKMEVWDFSLALSSSPSYSNCGPGTSNHKSTWKLAGDAASQAPSSCPESAPAFQEDGQECCVHASQSPVLTLFSAPRQVRDLELLQPLSSPICQAHGPFPQPLGELLKGQWRCLLPTHSACMTMGCFTSLSEFHLGLDS